MAENKKPKDSPKSRLRKFFNKRAVLIILIVGLAVFVLAGAYFIYQKAFENSSNQVKLTVTEVSEKDTPCSTRSDDSILYEAVVIMDPAGYAQDELSGRIERASVLQDKILGLENYLNDANCLHILAMTSILKNNSSDAEKYISLLEKKVQETSPDIYILDENPIFMPIEKMREYVSGARENAELQKDNFIYIDMGEQSAE